MKRALSLLLLVPSLASGQKTVTAAPTQPVRVEVFSVDTAKVALVSVSLTGDLFAAIGVLRPASGIVRMSGNGGTATTPATLELADSPGEISLSSDPKGPELHVTVQTGSASRPQIVAQGYDVHFIRDAAGRLSVRAAQMQTYFSPK